MGDIKKLETELSDDALVGGGDSVAGFVLHDVHRLVGLADEIGFGFGVIGEAGHADASCNHGVDALLAEENMLPNNPEQAARHDQRALLAGLRKQYDELVAAVAESEIDH